MDSNTQPLANWSTKAPSQSKVRQLNTYCINAVAPNSIASAGGLAAGDLILKINEAPAANFDFSEYHNWQRNFKYEFYQPQQKRWLDLEIDGRPLGIDVELSTQTIVHRARHEYEFECLVELWERGEWTLLSAWPKRGLF